MGPRARTALVAALAAQRLVELRQSARNRARGGAGNDRQAAPRTYPVMVGCHVALFAICAWPRQGRVRAPIEAAGLAGLTAATGLRLWVIRSLGGSWNVTAHVPPSLRVVTSGPYRRLRHPNYTAVVLEFVALPLAVGAVRQAWWLSLADAAVLWPRIRAEEALLDGVAGYRQAFAGVPRFLPRRGRVSGPAAA